MSLADYKGVFVYIEQRHGEVQTVSLELLGRGRHLADELGVELTGVLVGNNIKGLTDNIIQHGADKVIVADSEEYDIYSTEAYTQAVVEIINDKKPEIFLMGATTLGRDLGPRVSARLATGLVADCTSLDLSEDTKELMMTRPAFGGNLMATIMCPDHRPQIATVRPGVMEILHTEATRTGEVEDYAANLDTSKFKVKVLEVVKEEKELVKIEDATILVSGGRGVGNAENFSKLEDLATEVDAVVSGSRVAIDSGWLPADRQVGQTGKTVRPDLYFALGISGSIQHVAGMEESEYIIAVNKDKEAGIFNVADLGIVGDLHKIVPLLTEGLKKAKAEKANK